MPVFDGLVLDDFVDDGEMDDVGIEILDAHWFRYCMETPAPLAFTPVVS